MEPVPYSLIRTHENVLTESQGKMFSIDHRIFITTMRNEIYYTLVGELRFVLYARAPLLQSRILAACACNGKIAIIHGGYNRKERKVLGDILMFSGNVLQTIAAPCLPRRACHHASLRHSPINLWRANDTNQRLGWYPNSQPSRWNSYWPIGRRNEETI